MLWTVKKGLYRTQHRVMKSAAGVIPMRVPAVLSGPGSVLQLADNLSLRGHTSVLLVTDHVLMDLGLPSSLIGALEVRGIRVTVFQDVEPNPSIENVAAGVEAYRNANCDSIVAFGGGSPIDCAKVIGARIGNPLIPVRKMKGLFKVVLPIPPFFCVPTTAGTGSETTVAAVISDRQTHEKFAINDLKLIPLIAVLDPELMVGLPPHITAATGMDALTHAVEAYIGLNGSEFTDLHAERAVSLIFEFLPRAYANGKDMEARQAMALASFSGGAAFTRAYVGYVHAVAHNLGGLYGVPHGLANAIILPHVLRFCRDAAEDKLARLAVAGGIGTGSESAAVLSQRFIEHIEALNAEMKIPTVIKELRAEDIPLLAERALAEAHPEYPVPKFMTMDDCRALLAKLLA